MPNEFSVRCERLPENANAKQVSHLLKNEKEELANALFISGYAKNVNKAP